MKFYFQPERQKDINIKLCKFIKKLIIKLLKIYDI